LIGWIVSSKQASLADLQSVYGLEDAYDFLEIIMVNNSNSAAAVKRAKKGVGSGQHH